MTIIMTPVGIASCKRNYCLLCRGRRTIALCGLPNASGETGVRFTASP